MRDPICLNKWLLVCKCYNLVHNIYNLPTFESNCNGDYFNPHKYYGLLLRKEKNFQNEPLSRRSGKVKEKRMILLDNLYYYDRELCNLHI